MSKRIYFNTQKTITVTKKGYFEIDEDFTQVYKSFVKIALNIDGGTSWKLLFYLLAEASTLNGVIVSSKGHEKFVSYLKQNGADSISIATYYRCIEELCSAGALTKYSKGHYYLNPYIFWQSDKKQRVEFLQDESAELGGLSINPLKEITNTHNENI